MSGTGSRKPNIARLGMVWTMLAMAVSGDASRGGAPRRCRAARRSRRPPSVETATSSTCWPSSVASSADAPSQNAAGRVTPRPAPGRRRAASVAASSSRRTRSSAREAIASGRSSADQRARHPARRRDRPSAIASPMSCVTMMHASCARAAWMRRNSAWSCRRVTGSSAPNGSSISSTGGSTARARATPTR